MFTGGVGQPTAWMAALMVARVARGWDCIGTCDAATWLTTEPARAAMNCWVTGGMAWSFVETR